MMNIEAKNQRDLATASWWAGVVAQRELEAERRLLNPLTPDEAAELDTKLKAQCESRIAAQFGRRRMGAKERALRYGVRSTTTKHSHRIVQPDASEAGKSY